VSPAVEVASAVRELLRKGERFDLVFADPPYDSPTAPAELAEGARLLADGGVLVLQADSGVAEPALAGLALLDRRAYGRNVFFFFGMR
jgi:16S rRNA G966 N2-methylase RsmD